MIKHVTKVTANGYEDITQIGQSLPHSKTCDFSSCRQRFPAEVSSGGLSVSQSARAQKWLDQLVQVATRWDQALAQGWKIVFICGGF